MQKPILLVTIFFLIFTSCSKQSKQPAKNRYSNINAEQAKKIIDGNKNNEHFLILDVRTASEFKEEHLKNATNADVNLPGFKKKVTPMIKGNIVLLHCLSGARSSGALETLKKLDYIKIYHLDSGILGWKAKNYPTIKLK